MRERKIFAPEKEIEKVKSATGIRRREKYQKFAAEFMEQQEGIMDMQGNLIGFIRENPDISQDKLINMARAGSKKLRLSKESRGVIEEIIYEYVRKHTAIKTIREQNPDDIELFIALFSKPPEGRIEIIEKPIMIGVRCQNPADYAYIWDTFTQRADDDRYSERQSGAVLLDRCAIPKLGGLVAVERQKIYFADREKREETMAHEEQHVINKLFLDKFTEFLFPPEPDFNYENFEAEVETYLPVAQAYFEEIIRDEILACFRSDGATVEVYNTLTKENGLYDYETFFREKILEKTAEVGADKIKIKGMLVEMSQRYRKHVWEGIEALRILSSAGWTYNRIIPYVARLPLRRWKRAAVRMTSKKE